MNDIPPDMLFEVVREIVEDRGPQDQYDVSLEELLDRLMAKGWRLKAQPLAESEPVGLIPTVPS